MISHTAFVLIVFALVGQVIAAAQATQPSSQPAPAKNVVSDIEYGRAGDSSLRLDACSPAGTGPFPVVIFVHGGGWSSGDKKSDFTTLYKPLQDAGFTWFSINYRLAPANRWPACYDDVQTAVRWVKAHAAEYQGDPNRIALCGYSAGGQLVCLSAVLASDDTRVQAVVGLAAPTDLVADCQRRGGVSTSLQGVLNVSEPLTDDTLKILRDLSAIQHVQPHLPPFLLVHGTADKSVPYVQSIAFKAQLDAAVVPCELITLDGAPHNMKEWDARHPGYELQITDWLKHILVK